MTTTPLSPWLPVHSVTAPVPAEVLPPPESLVLTAVEDPVAALTASLRGTLTAARPPPSSLWLAYSDVTMPVNSLGAALVGLSRTLVGNSSHHFQHRLHCACPAKFILKSSH